MTGSVSVIVPLADHHDRTSFSCGLEALDRYLREQAGQDLRRRLSAVFVFCKPGSDRILGYSTLSSCQVDVVSLPPSLAKRLPRRPVPATPIGRLAVDRTYQGQGAGAVLLVSALVRAARASREVAALMVIVDAKGDEARSFYEHFGFQCFLDEPYRLFLPMADAEQVAQDAGYVS